MPTTLDFALGYVSKGWRVLPLHSITPEKTCTCGKADCHSPGKHPRLENGVKGASAEKNKVIGWWKDWPEANVGIACGRDSNLLVLDVDNAQFDQGEESLKELLNGDGEPETVQVLTGNGRHLYFLHPGGTVKNKVKLLDGLDIRSDGGYVVAPPSRHINGRTYEFEASSHPKDVPISEAPKWLLKALSEHGSYSTDIKSPNSNYKITQYQLPLKAEKIKEGERNASLTSFAGTLRRKGCTLAEITEATLRRNAEACDPPLERSEVEGIAKSVAQYAPHKEEYHHTDLGNAQRLAENCGEDIRFLGDRKEWLLWKGNRWDVDRGAEIIAKAVATIRRMYAEASAIEEKKERLAFLEWIRQSESRSRISNMLDLGRGMPNMLIQPDDLDEDPYLFNVENGTVDLKRGELREHRKTDFLSRLAPVEFNPSAKCPRWTAFLEEILQGNADLIAFLKTAIGWSLTGVLEENVVFILYGKGSNGKTTFLSTLEHLFGDYAVHTPTETLLARRNDTIPNDLARLKGTRLVTAVEAGEGRRLNESRIKQLTGGDTISARFLHGEFFDFKPTFKLWFGTNHKPVIKETTHAIWRRIRLVPFTVQIPEDRQDKRLGAKLAEELPGILNWCLDGCLNWQVQGELGYPEAVRNATQEYRSEMDLVGEFLDDRCIIEPEAKLKSSLLYAEYKTWCESAGERPLSQRDLASELAEKDFITKRLANGYHWLGIGLRGE